jgi:hypothetical protein
MRTCARKGSRLYWRSTSLRRPNQKRLDLFNPALSKKPCYLKDVAASRAFKILCSFFAIF